MEKRFLKGKLAEDQRFLCDPYLSRMAISDWIFEPFKEYANSLVKRIGLYTFLCRETRYSVGLDLRLEFCCYCCWVCVAFCLNIAFINGIILLNKSGFKPITFYIYYPFRCFCQVTVCVTVETIHNYYVYQWLVLIHVVIMNCFNCDTFLRILYQHELFYTPLNLCVCFGDTYNLMGISVLIQLLHLY